ncbi:MAG TPA: LemA family protein [Thermoanaerobaculia bacterium]|jgi:LemA protein|nr:LemA family protein [Thermoanaerobaculia bacterium]
MKNLGCLIVAGVLVLLVLWGIGSYNGLVGAQQAVESQWAQVENVYQRRADLIPNLVASVRGAANFERGTLTDVVEARARVGQVNAQATSEILNDPQKFQQFQQAQDQLSSALSRLLVVVERYPELKAVQGFQDLMVALEGAENRIATERRRFNEVAQDYNTRVKRFPTNLFANIFGFQPKPYFTSQPGAETAPKVDFGDMAPSPTPR